MSQPHALGVSTKAPATYDVVILGSGIAGSILGAILARHQVKVLLIDHDEHPRFALGESTIPHTSMLLRILAARFDVPALKDYSAFNSIRERVAPSCGIKRNFGFVYHREGQSQNPVEATQSVIPEYPDGPESHLFRQDIDYYLLCLAVHYGAVSRQRFLVSEVEIDSSGVTLATAQGETVRARYVVDAGGYRSPLAKKFALREQPTRLHTHSRSIFTHLVDVMPYDACVTPKGAHGMPRQWCQGTLHHLFDGGWMWVIPFDNYPGAINPMCSVGLSLDPRRFPKNGQSGEDEFWEFLDRYPSIGLQFQQAKTVRNWVSTDRLQYSSKCTVGDRFCLMAQAGGAIDALFSRGLANTMEVINAFVPRFLAALADDDLSAARFADLEALQQRQLDYNDRLVACSYTAFRSFPLWNAWYRIWVLGAFYGWLRLNRGYKRFEESGDPRWLDQLDSPSHWGSIAPQNESFETLFVAMASELEAVEAGTRTPEQAHDQIADLLAASPIIPPIFALTDFSKRSTVELGQAQFLELLQWFRRDAPAEIRNLYFG